MPDSSQQTTDKTPINVNLDALFDDLHVILTGYQSDADIDKVRRAFEFARHAHRNQKRKTGEPYITHPLAVATILSEMRLDVDSVCTGLLHDTVEDTEATDDDLRHAFGDDVATLVDGVTKLAQIRFRNVEEKLAENFRKMLVAMSRDIRVLLVKLADRLHNMRTMASMRPDKAERIARETMEIYAPLAHRLGISWVKTELEDLSFRYMDALAYRDLATSLGKTRSERGEFIDDVSRIVSNKLETAGINDVEVSGRPKHLWSIHKKMKSKNLPFEEIYDLIAFRVIAGSVGRCYEVLGHLHAIWRPVPGRFKDYIAMPKPNGYQSLHTTVIGPGGERIEIQIRTEAMHHIAEDGIAAHWKYKESGGSSEVNVEASDGFAWLKNLLDMQRELDDPSEFLDTVKVDLFADEVYIFTPGGDVLELTRGATPVDFAFSIHTDVGMRCSGAKVNGRIVPLRHELESGDTCEIITSPHQQPNKDWLEFAHTSRARQKIRAHLRRKERERAKQIAEELLEREFRRRGKGFQKFAKSKNLAVKLGNAKYKNLEDILIGVGYGKLSASDVAEAILPQSQPIAQPEESSTLEKIFERARKKRKTSSAVLVDGNDDVLVHFGKCCSPLRGDLIIGFVTRGRGVTVHRNDCSRVHASDRARQIDVSWDADGQGQHPVTLRVTTREREGMLSDLTGVFSKHSVSILEARCRVDGPDHAVNTFRCTIGDASQLKNLMRDLGTVKGVHDVTRTRAGEL